MLKRTKIITNFKDKQVSFTSNIIINKLCKYVWLKYDKYKGKKMV